MLLMALIKKQKQLLKKLFSATNTKTGAGCNNVGYELLSTELFLSSEKLCFLISVLEFSHFMSGTNSANKEERNYSTALPFALE